jgi:pilus assembly protein Flp/PilA
LLIPTRQLRSLSHQALLWLAGISKGVFSMRNSLNRFIADENGATAIEYGLIAALIAVVVIGTLTTVGTNLDTKFGAVATALR